MFERIHPSVARLGMAGFAVAIAAACQPGAEPAAENMIQLLESGEPVFGIFSGDHTAEQGAAVAANAEIDFVFYSLESGPFDLPALETYMAAMMEAVGERAPHPVLLRIPPIRDGHELARSRSEQGLEAGVAGIVFPHLETAEEARLAVDATGPDGWPGNPDGRLINLLLIEDEAGLDNVREIVSTPGVSAVSPGPGDLGRLYEDDMEAVERVIQKVLAACKEFSVVCGITADVDDIAERLAQGFRFIIARSPEAVSVGRSAAGRTP